jgi:outer membrane protein TolC
MGGKRLLLVLALSLGGAIPVAQAAPPDAPPAGNVRSLSLEEAKEPALQNNRSLGLARLNVEEKQHATTAATKDYLPKALGNVSYFHFNDDLGTVLTVQRGRFGILPPGAITTPVAIANQDSTLATAFLAQPITKLIAVNAAVQAARADERIASAKLDKATGDLLSGVAQVYYGLLGGRRIERALVLQIQVLEQMEKQKSVPELRVGILEAKQGLLQVRGQTQALALQLNNLLGLPNCEVLELVDPVPTFRALGCIDEVVHQALANNADIKEAEQNITRARAALQVARMDSLPDVSVIGGYANQTISNSVQPNIGYVGVAASYTFWDWGKKRDVRRQRLTTVALAQQNLQVTIEKVEMEARKAYLSFDQARDAYQLAKEMVQARQDATKGAADAAAAMAALAKSQLEAMKSEIAYRIAHAQLMQWIGGE